MARSYQVKRICVKSHGEHGWPFGQLVVFAYLGVVPPSCQPTDSIILELHSNSCILAETRGGGVTICSGKCEARLGSYPF